MTLNHVEPKAKLEWAFLLYDIDGNGKIDKSEMEEIMQAIYDMIGDKVKRERLDTPKYRTDKIFAVMDKNNDDVLSKEEFIEGCMKDKFVSQMLKDCPRGVITEESFKKIYRQFFPNNVADNFCRHLFRSFKKDRNGMMHFREFLLAVYVTSRRADPTEKLRWAFRLYDVNGSGRIEKQELEQVLQSMYEMMEVEKYEPDLEPVKSRVEKLFVVLDADRDGVIDLHEFIDGCLANRNIYRLLTTDPGDALFSSSEMRIYR
nr:hypothetical protein BaRGS_009328 [Batillaria attramentaria]